MKKNIILTAVISVGATILLGLGIMFIKNVFEQRRVNEVGLKEIKEVSYTLPNFTILTTGIVRTYFASEDLDSVVTKYEFDAVMNDGMEREFNTYEGIRLNEVLSLYDIGDYSEIVLKSNGGLELKYKKEEITDNIFLVFTKNGEMYPDGEPVTVINTDVLERYNITNVVEIEFR